MRGSVALAGAVLGAVAAVGMPATVAAEPDPYSPGVISRLIVSTPSPIEVQSRITISVKVASNSPVTPTGTVRLTLTALRGGAGQSMAAAAGPDGWSRTVAYTGGTERVVGPELPTTGAWLLTGVFRPSSDDFRGDRDAWVFRVVNSTDEDEGPDEEGPGGLLPDTGGPALFWLLLGVGLVGGGAATVVYARRRTMPATA